MNRRGFTDLLRFLSFASPAKLRLDSLRSSRKSRRPRLGFESLEARRVLAANITAFEPTDSGFVVELSEEVSTLNLNLYNTEGGTQGAADVTLQGATTGDVKGSLVVDGTRLTFVASDGVLAADTYTATLRSASDAFTDLADGELLDGEYNGTTLPSGNGTAGGDFVIQFTVGTSTDMILGLPDFARGPSQAVQAPGQGSGTELPDGLAVVLTNPAGLTSVTFTLQYDPSLLNISDVQLGADAPAGSSVDANLTVPGTATVSFYALAPLTASQTNVIELIASVPEDASYGSTQVLSFSSVEVNAGAMTAQVDSGVQLVSYAGDVNANRRYDAEDARLIARVGVGLDTGFLGSADSTPSTTPLFALIDPTIMGDITGAGGISALDASDILRKVVGLPVPNLPDLPSSQAPFGLSLSSQSATSSQAIGSVVGSFSTSDPDAGDSFTYALVAGSGDTNNSSFSISGSNLLTAEALSASPGTYSIRVSTTDSTGKSFVRNFTITVSDTNNPPSSVALSTTNLTDGQAIGTTVGTLTTVDTDAGDSHVYTLVSGDGSADNAKFTLSGNTLLTAVVFDANTQNSYTIRIRSTDSAGAFVEQVLTGTILAAGSNTAPTAIGLSNSNVPENSASGTVVGALTSTDADAGDTFTYTLVSGAGDTDNASFAISGATLTTAAVLDFESQESYSVRVRSTDAGGLTFEQTFTITATNVNEAATSVTLSSSQVEDGDASGTVVGTLASDDPDAADTFTYTLVAGSGDTDNASFAISGDQLQTAFVADMGTKASYAVRVMVTDAGGLTHEEELTITVVEVGVAPTAVALSSTAIDEGSAIGSDVGTLTSTDANATDSHTYTLVAGTGDTDNASFTIVGDKLQTAAELDFETQDTYSVRVRSTDSYGLTFDQEFTITVNDLNETPSALSLDNLTVAENAVSGTLVGNLSTTDPDAGDTFTYTLEAGVGDTDNASFTISGSTLTTAAVLDFESQESYSVRVRSTDAGGLTFEQTFTITATNVNEAATSVTLSSSQVEDGAASGTAVGTLSSDDPDAADTFTYTLVAGSGDTDNASFAISGDQLQTAFVADMGTKASYAVRVMVTDAGGLTHEEELTITVVEVGVAPTAVALSSTAIDEGSAIGSDVGTLTSTDANATDSHTYTLVAGTGDTDNASFTIVGDKLQTAAELDFETQDTYSVRVRSTDSYGLTFDQEFTITVNDLNETPSALSLDNLTVAENAVSGTLVGNLTTTDPDAGDTFTYTLEAGTGDTDNASFAISGATLTTAAVLDFESQESYSVRVRSTDAGGLTFEQTFTITATNVNEAATSVTLSSSQVEDGAASGTVVGTLASDDPDAADTFTYTLVAGSGDTDNASFAISGDQLQTAFIADMGTKASYAIRVMVTDAGGLTHEEELTITVVEVGVAPTAVALSSTAIDEGSAIGSDVGTLTSTDANAIDSHTYTLVAGTGDTDNASFTIVGDKLQTAAELDFETQDTYSVRVRSTDSYGLTFDQEFTITVSDLNETPTALALDNLTIAENAVSGTLVGNLTTTDADAGDSFTYTLEAGAGDTDNASFAISGSTLTTAAVLDFESQESYSVRVRSTDAGGLIFEQTFTITATNVNEAATSVVLSSSQVEDAAASGTAVGTLSSDDPDAADTFTYTLVAGSGDTDNASFAISGDELQTAFVADMGTKASYAIRVMVTDAGGLTHEEELTITVVEVGVAPTAVALSSTTIDEGSAIGTEIGTLTSTDANAIDSHTYTLVAGTGDTDNASFAIVGDKLQTAAELDFETQDTYSVRVRSTDSYGLTFDQEFTITVSDLNETPTALALDNLTIAENAVSGTLVGNLTTTDADAGDTFTYTLEAGVGDTDNASFTISGSTLTTAAVLDFESQESYSVRVRSTDAGGLIFEQTFTITAANVNEAATSVVLSSSQVEDGAASGTVVGILSSDDPDAGDTFTYTLVAGSGDTDNASFAISGDQLQTAFIADMGTKASYAIRVMVTDAGGLTHEEELTITVVEVGVAPTAVALSSTAIDEGSAIGSDVGTLTSTDANATDSHTYTLVAGTGDTDNASFTIVGDKLQTAAELDFETQDTYSVRVRSTDSYGLTFDQEFTITVNDLNETPSAVALDNLTVAENAVSGTLVGNLSTTDPDAGDTFTYTLEAGMGDTDNASFAISGATLTTAAVLDFESQESYSVRVRSTDAGGLTFEQTFTITATNVNEAATSVTLSSSQVEDGAASGTAVGTLASDDPDAADTFTYTLVAGSGDTDNASFTISGDQLQTAFIADMGTKASYAIRVMVTDAGGLTHEEELNITVVEVGVAPTAVALSSTAIDEGSAIGSDVGTLTSTDANAIDSHTYTLVAGTGDTDNASFTIVGDKLQTAAELDFETQDTYSVRVRSTDSYGLTFDQEFTITVNGVNETPSAVALDNLTIAENAVSGTLVGNLTTTDADAGDTFTYTLEAGVGDTDNASFTISGSTLTTAAVLDFESQESYSVRVRSTDAGGLIFEQTFTITAANVNEAATSVVLSSSQVEDGAASGTVVGTLSSDDPDAGDTFTYTLVAGSGDTDNASFAISGDQLQTAFIADMGTKASYAIRVMVTDAGGLTHEEELTITIVEAGVAPTAVALGSTAIDEGSAIGSDVGTLTSTDANAIDSHTYTLVAGTGDTDNASFTIVGDKLQTAAELDFETQDTYYVRVRSTDSYGLTFDQEFTITINDIVE
ncbi:cadherin repeat domain-containing protein [Aureliella helgolandensis]|uniref:Fatty acid biosynthesis transcriptional regulator n=1 Tax=Aureliella helgolandensis TaxID=2527968 RepID=A0A518G3E7_9BACT|nr:cadherin repeat domain-containing protein [Aureliella helgolandensis]QDV23127.1 fatty acid biosynthesis transcriptional regulator [Aureliella helgolandensis]